MILDLNPYDRNEYYYTLGERKLNNRHTIPSNRWVDILSIRKADESTRPSEAVEESSS